MKDKIITFVIGLLIGAVITSAGFLIYSKNTTSSSNQGQMGGPGGQGGPGSSMQNSTNGEPPTMPSGNSVSSNTTTVTQ